MQHNDEHRIGEHSTDDTKVSHLYTCFYGNLRKN